ncbi:unnamed protein product [Phyllotreta striolata]|uniref:SOCS box domain-containing protein n=1 Tax=Phyllotreta striolata TaxID=444603 RepID=A0A9N9TPR5_PHYSR|nr:unnamed protein product [Phyllotreta striolata]
MEYFLRCYFEQFASLPRNSLHDRRKRQSMVDYISTMIEGCSTVETNVDESAKIAIKTIVKYHEENKSENGNVCMMGKYHNILYIAVKLCFVWQIKDPPTVTQLLEEIFRCENTFERILIGAIFGGKAPHYVAGWKSDFASEEENLRAVVYFLDKANKGKLLLKPHRDQETYRFVDTPMESCGKASPLKICVQLGLPDKLLILLRFGARIHHQHAIIEHLLNRLLEFNRVYPYNLVSCLQLLLRATERIPTEDLVDPDLRKLMYDKYCVLVEDGLIPPSRCGIIPVELKHLCRCSVREYLWRNHGLPDGLKSLKIPEDLRRYLDLLQD